MIIHVEIRCQECSAVIDSRTFCVPSEIDALGCVVRHYEDQGYTVSASDTQTTVGHHKQNCGNDRKGSR